MHITRTQTGARTPDERLPIESRRHLANGTDY